MKKKILFIGGSIFLILIIGIIIYYNIMLKNNAPVLAYHNVLEKTEVDTDVSIKNFEWQMKWLAKHNYQSLSMDEFYNWKQGKKNFKNKKVLITFDDGYEGTYKNAIPILEKYNLKATIFVIGDRINKENYMTTEQIEDIKKNHPLISIENHTYSLHELERAESNDYEIYDRDMKRTSSEGYKYIAYPFGIYNKTYIKAIKDNGYELAFLYAPSKWVNRNDNNYELGRVPVYDSTTNTKFIAKMRLKVR